MFSVVGTMMASLCVWGMRLVYIKGDYTYRKKCKNKNASCTDISPDTVMLF